MSRYSIVSTKNFLIELRSVFVLERKKTTNHGKQYNSCTPDIHHDWLVGNFSLNHLGGSIAGGSTGSPESFLYLVSIWQAKIDHSYCPVVVNKTIFKL